MKNVTIRIPAALREFAGGMAELELQAVTAGTALEKLSERFPLLSQRIVDQDGAVRTYVNIFVGETNIRDSSGLETRLADGDIVTIIPAVAGGLQ